MEKFKSICVFCGSNVGSKLSYTDAAREMGYVLASQNIRLIFGGGQVGLMGIIADAVLKRNGKVTGVIPKFLASKEVAHESVDEMIVVKTMHERKQEMADLSDGFIAMPGGMGTMEELFEVVTWGQLGLHHKPIGLLNTDGYYDDLIRFIDKMVENRFLSEQNRAAILVSESPTELLSKMEAWQAPDAKQWLNRSRT